MDGGFWVEVWVRNGRMGGWVAGTGRDMEMGDGDGDGDGDEGEGGLR